MTQQRFSIRSLLSLVAAVALNVALGQCLSQNNEELLIGIALPAVALQLFGYAVWKRRPKPFQLGYLVFGAIATGSFVWAMCFPRSLGITANGQTFIQPGSTLFMIWMGYGRFAGDWLMPILFKNLLQTQPSDFSMLALRMLIWTLPQFLIGAVGGAISRGIVRCLPARPKADPSESALASNRAVCEKSQAVLAASPTILSN